MAQHLEVLIPAERYTRTDFTALRAWLNKLPISRIAQMYYTEDDLEALGCEQSTDLQYRLERLRDTLIQRASDINPHAADGLRTARRVHNWSKAAIDFITQSADADFTRPRKSDPVSAWLRGRVATVLKGEGLLTIEDLRNTILQRGQGWWKPIPRIGEGKAAAIVRWLQSHESALGTLTLKATAPLAASDLIVLQPERQVMVPLDRAVLPSEFDGRNGLNRNHAFPLISARHDLAAIEAYLYTFRDQEKTERAYRKELERFLLWCIYERRKPMSSVLTEDCEAYKDFLAHPKADWIGPRSQRRAEGWKPFAGIPSPASQRYAVQAIRSFFKWLVDVRYLSGNPWITVSDPRVAQPITALQIQKALPQALWEKLTERGGLLDQQCAQSDRLLRERYRLRGAAANISLSAQFRLVRAALILMGETGLRREEAAYATRDKLKPVQGEPGLWEMDVLGKRNKWRTVLMPQRVIDAIEAHWADRGCDFSFGMAEIPLLSPLFMPPTRDATLKHLTDDGERKESGFSPDGLYQVIKTAMTRMADDLSLPLDEWEREFLEKTGPHSFRHTFGSQAVAGDVPLDVTQQMLGHTSLQTTTIYVQAEKSRSISEMGKWYRKKSEGFKL